MLFKAEIAVAAGLALAILLAGSAQAHPFKRCHRHYHWSHRTHHCGRFDHNGHDRYNANLSARRGDKDNGHDRGNGHDRDNGHDRGNGSHTK